MWQIISRPVLLIYLAASFPVSTARRKLDWQEKDYQEQLRRLAHAREHAHLVIDTDNLTPDQVLQKALDFLEAERHMKKLFVTLLGLSLLLASCTPASPKRKPPRLTPILSTRRGQIVPFSKVDLSNQNNPSWNALDGASVYHIEIDIAPDLYHITGHEEVHYTNTETVALNEIEFRLFPNILGGKMEVSNLLVGGQTYYARVSTEQQPARPATSIDPLAPGQSIVIGMDFDVTVPQSVDLNYGVLAYYEDVLALAHAYPMIAVYDDEGWNAEIPPQSGDVTYADASFFLVKITAPRK